MNRRRGRHTQLRQGRRLAAQRRVPRERCTPHSSPDAGRRTPQAGTPWRVRASTALRPAALVFRSTAGRQAILTQPAHWGLGAAACALKCVPARSGAAEETLVCASRARKQLRGSRRNRRQHALSRLLEHGLPPPPSTRAPPPTPPARHLCNWPRPRRLRRCRRRRRAPGRGAQRRVAATSASRRGRGSGRRRQWRRGRRRRWPRCEACARGGASSYFCNSPHYVDLRCSMQVTGRRCCNACCNSIVAAATIRSSPMISVAVVFESRCHEALKLFRHTT